jgi:hypothetical protein
MRLDDRDRGRILLAVVVTLLALPAIWLANRRADESTRPNVAVAGLDPGEAGTADQTGTAGEAGTTGATGVEPGAEDGFDPMGDAGAAYIEANPTATDAPAPELAIGTTPDEIVGTALGTYHAEGAWDRCLYNGAGLGVEVTVVNVANGRSTTCTTAYLPGGGDEIVLHQERFRRIADLVNAPIHVEIRR